MNFDIDFFIVVGFLLLTLLVGINYGKKVRTIKDYALGGRNFSTVALVATIVATQASGSGFFTTLTKTYTDGFYYLFSSLGVGISIALTSIVLIPRMEEFLGKLSIAEAMGDIYGQKVRLITAIAGTIGASGLIAVQFKVFGGILSYLLSMPNYLTIIVGGLITTVYSAGGIRSVTFTDVLQGFTFGVIIPLLGFAIWSQFYHMDYSLSSALEDQKFNIKLLYDSTNYNFWNCIFLFILFSIPAISVPTFQRIAMGSNINQIKKSFIIAALILILIKLAIVWIPFLLYTINPTLQSNELLSYLVDTYSFTGLKGLILIAIIAFTMSTADSYINSSVVLFTYDIYGLFSLKNNSLFIAKLFTFALGGFSIILSLIKTDLLGIIIFANSFYFPVVTPAFLLAIFGFRSSTKSVLIGMFVSMIITILWKILPSDVLPFAQNVIGFLFAMLCNVIFLMGSHYLLRQPGGWMTKRDKSHCTEKQQNATSIKSRFLIFINEFDLMWHLRKLSPNHDIAYTFLGVYFIICTITTMYSTQIELLGTNAQLMSIIYPSMLVTGTSMTLYPIWPLSVSTNIKETIVQIWYPVAVFYMLIFFSIFFVLVSNFAMLQVALLMMNLMIASLLLGWRLVLPLIFIGLYVAIKFYQYFFSIDNFAIQFGSPEFILLYLLLIASVALLLFLKPHQEQQKATEAKVTDLDEKVIHYSERVSDQEREIERLGATAQKILNNVNHELRIPVSNVMNFADMLNKSLCKCDQQQLKVLSDEFIKNSNRLSSMILNMLDLATLNAKKLELNKKTINLGVLVEERVKNCIKIYLEGKKIDFELKIHSEIFISVDSNYMQQVVDNLVINAIRFSNKGKITIQLLKKNNIVEFTITDNGIDIPKEEIYDIFTPFKMGSNTESKAEGRGVGLALCKAAIEAHNGSITAKSNGKNGATFTFTLSEGLHNIC